MHNARVRDVSMGGAAVSVDLSDMASAGGSGGSRSAARASELQQPNTTTSPPTLSPASTPPSSCTHSRDACSQQDSSAVSPSSHCQINSQYQNSAGASSHQNTSLQISPASAQTARSETLPPPPSYVSSVQQTHTRGAQQPLFLPYVTQELPRYTEVVSDAIPHRIGQIGEVQLGFVRQAGGHCVPIQIPGYISTTTDELHTSLSPPFIQTSGRGYGTGTDFTTVTRRHPEVAPPPNDYYKFTFFLLILCAFHLNLPAILMLLCSLFFSVKVKEKRASRQYVECRKYSTMVLICNYLAILEYFIIVISALTTIILIFVFDVKIT